MATNVSAGIKLSALIDGTTVQGMLLSTKPLTQCFKEADKTVAIPDFETNPETRPIIYLLINDTALGSRFSNEKIKNLRWFYNSVEVTFGPEGLSSNSDFTGLFKIVTYEKNGVSVPAIEVQKNFPQFGNYDNDIISVEASIEMNGAQMWVKDISIPVVVQPMTGNIYSVHLDDKYGFTIPKDPSITQTETTAQLLIDGVVASAQKLSDLGAKFVWEKMVGGSATLIIEGNKVTIKKDDIKNVLIVRCRAVGKDGNVLASVYASYTDASDPYFINFIKTLKGNNAVLQGTTVRRGQTAIITPEILSRSSNQKYVGQVEWNFYAYNNNGEAYSGSPAIVKNVDNCEVSYDAIVAANMNMNIVVDATI